MSSGPVAVGLSIDLKGLIFASDAWLSDTVGWQCFTVLEGSLSEVNDYPRKPGRHFYAAKVPVGQAARTEGLIRRGFTVIDTSLTLRREVPRGHHSRACTELRRSNSDGLSLTAAGPEESTAVADIASRAFRYSRFHLDPRFPDEAARRIKEEWARNLALGRRGEGCLVARKGNRIMGFLGYHRPLQQDAPAVIDLVAVEPSEQGTGIGREIVAKFLEDASNDGRAVIVCTQAANRSAVRLYEDLGFRLDSADYVLHGHTMMTPRP